MLRGEEAALPVDHEVLREIAVAEDGRVHRAGARRRGRVLDRIDGAEDPDRVAVTIPEVPGEMVGRAEVVEEPLHRWCRRAVRGAVAHERRQDDERAVQPHHPVHRGVQRVEVEVRPRRGGGEREHDLLAVGERSGLDDPGDRERVRTAVRDLVPDPEVDGVALDDEDRRAGDARAEQHAADGEAGLEGPARHADAVHHLGVRLDHVELELEAVRQRRDGTEEAVPAGGADRHRGRRLAAELQEFTPVHFRSGDCVRPRRCGREGSFEVELEE
jgi:hypothetical protein